MQIATRRAAPPVLSFFFLAAFAGGATAGNDWPDLLRGVPAGANALGLVDAAFLREQVQNRQGSAEFLETVKWLLSDTVVRGVFAAEMDLTKMEPAWEVGVVGVSKMVTPEKLAKLSRGFIDEIGGMKVVCSPRDAYLGAIDFDKAMAYHPANRSAVARLIRDRKAGGKASLSPYLQKVADVGTLKVPIVLALDLTDAVSPASARQKLATLASLAGANLNLDDVAALLGDLKGVTFTATAERKGYGVLRIDFGRSPSVVELVGRAMVAEIFGRAGAALPELERWDFTIQENAIVLQGNLSATTLSHILSVFSTPFALGSTQSAGAADSNPANDQQRKGIASKRYYSDVTKIVERLRGDKAQTLGQRALWCDREGRRIDHLPILDVDPMLLDYGAAVSSLLRGSGLEIRNVNMKAETQTDKSMVFGGYGYGWGGYSNAAAGLANRETNNLNVRAQQNLSAQGAYLEAMGKIDQMTADVRRKMTEKFQIEF